MQSEPRRRRKRFIRPPSSRFRWWCVFFLLFFPTFFFFLYGSPSGSDLFRPVLRAFRTKPLSSISTSSVRDSSSELSHALSVEDRVVFPDHVLLLISTTLLSSSSNLVLLDCVYQSQIWETRRPVVVLPALSVDYYDEFRSIARCPLPPSNFSNVVELRNRTVVDQNEINDALVVVNGQSRAHSWERLVYAAALDGDACVVFVKGLNLRPGRLSDPAPFSCQFNWVDSRRRNKYVANTAMAVTAAQEIVRCTLPSSLKNHPSEAHGIQVSINVASRHHRLAAIGANRFRRRVSVGAALPSVARLFNSKIEEKERENKFELCVCTMVWNQALFLREWIVYHGWLGVERWFIYDNNSDDSIVEEIEELQRESYNVSRHVWPWIKTQEAGFSHCALRARSECKWMAFMDVDEFFYFKFPTGRHRKSARDFRYPDSGSLRLLVANFSASSTIGEIRTVCHSFGPSGLSSAPSHGVTVGYTCRLQSPERHKSIVRLDALHKSLLNLVHHFQLRPGYKYLNLPQNIAVINHYKYQVWEVFRAKFFRRVATYVTDWQENQNEGSKDRAPGLGTEAIEPPNWAHQFCEVWDTGLRDFVMANLVDLLSGLLPWERH